MESAIAVVILVTQLTTLIVDHKEHDDSARQIHKHAMATEVADSIAHTEWHNTFDKWLPILQCEANGDWYANTGNGYYGGLQFAAQTWNAFKPDNFPAYAHEASPAQQVLVAERVLAAQTWAAWPACSRKVGYR